MGNPLGIALFSFMANVFASDSKLRVLMLAVAVSGVVILGSIGIVRYANRGRQVTPAIADAALKLGSIPDSLLIAIPDRAQFTSRRDEFAQQLEDGTLPVDSVRAFYHSYALWMRDGRWDADDIDSLANYLGTSDTP